MSGSPGRRESPDLAYERPGDVLSDSQLTTEQRLAILREWRFDELERMVAEEENMGGGRSSQLAAVDAALAELGEPEPAVRTPTKHGSV